MYIHTSRNPDRAPKHRAVASFEALIPNSPPHRRARIREIIASPGRLKREDQNLLWTFRHSLVSDRKALTKFVCSVDWTDEHEVKQALALRIMPIVRLEVGTTDAARPEPRR